MLIGDWGEKIAECRLKDIQYFFVIFFFYILGLGYRMHSAHRKERASNMICNARYLNIGMVKLYDFRYLSIL